MHKVMLSSALTEAKVDGLVQTIDSRFKAFERGVELILLRLTPLDDRITKLEAVKYQAAGALWLVRVLGVTGIGAFLMFIVKMWRTP